jgi:hypothetical protein
MEATGGSKPDHHQSKEKEVNLEIGAINSRTFRRISIQYLALIGGLCLAFGVFVAMGGLVIDFGGSNAVVSKPVSLAAASADQQYVTYYLVDSEAQRDLVFAGEAEGARERFSSGMRDANSSFIVFVASTPEEVDSARVAIYEGSYADADAGTVVRIVDLLR